MADKSIKIISFLGLPASGKGTQAKILADKIGANILAVGELIRDEIQNADLSDPFYADMKTKYNEGIPQTDEVVLDIIKKNIQRFGNKIIFDNFPFSEKQAELFLNLCRDINADTPILLLVKINRDAALKRIMSRKICSACKTVYIDDGNQICEKCGAALVSRVDDNEETLKRRINEYIPRMKEVANVFEKNGKIFEIEGEKSIKKVSEQIFKDLNDANAI